MNMGRQTLDKLQKARKDFTEKDYKEIEKAVGQDNPYPMTDMGRVIDKNGRVGRERFLGVLQKAMSVYSDLPQDEIEAILTRDMPTPEMLDLMFELLQAVNPRNRNRSMFLVGGAGTGKTYLGQVAGRLVSRKEALEIDCTGLNLNELFWETVLDFKGDKSLYDALDTKIAQYNKVVADKDARDAIMNPDSVNTLRSCLGEAFTEDKKGRITIVWDKVKQAHKGKDENDDDYYLSSEESSKIAEEGLTKVMKYMGLMSSSNALGLATQPGPAYQAYKEGRVLILDEINRAKKGTFGVMHRWAQFIVGERSKCAIRNPLKEKNDTVSDSLMFDEGEMGAGHFVYMTGNTLGDSDEVLEMPEALYSRFVPIHVPESTVQGWHHRFCQLFSGLPVSTLYKSQKDIWDLEPKAFQEYLLKMRQYKEDRQIPAHQMTFLKNWEQFNEAMENLSGFMYEASKIINPDSDYHKFGVLKDYLDEIDESFKKETAVDFRKIRYFLERAFMPKPVVRPPQVKDGASVVPMFNADDMPETAADIPNKLGTCVTYEIMKWVQQISYDRGKEALGDELMKLAEDFHIVTPHLQEGKRSKSRTVAQLLDHNPYDSADVNVRTEFIRGLVCRRLRAEHPDMMKKTDEQIVSLDVVQKAVEAVEAGHGAYSAKKTELFVVSDKKTHVADDLFQKAHVVDQAAHKDIGIVTKAKNLVSREEVLATVAMPGVRDRNLSTLWTKTLKAKGVFGSPSAGSGYDPHHGYNPMSGDGRSDFETLVETMADGGAGSPVLVTTIMVSETGSQNKVKTVPMHLVWNKRQDRLLVVGSGAIGKDLQGALRSARVAYINQDDKQSVRKLQTALAGVIGVGGAEKTSALRKAFLVRAAGKQQKEDDRSLIALLMDKTLKPKLPQYIVHGAVPPPKPKAA